MHSLENMLYRARLIEEKPWGRSRVKENQSKELLCLFYNY